MVGGANDLYTVVVDSEVCFGRYRIIYYSVSTAGGISNFVRRNRDS
jgi:hypothetical protein